MKRLIAMLLCSALVISLAVFAAPKSIINTEKTETASADDYSEVYNAIQSAMKNIDYIETTSLNVLYDTAAADAAVPEAEYEPDSLKAYSDTNTQVEGIDEADIVKTDGEYIYAVYDNTIKIYKAAGEDTVLVKELTVCNDNTCYPSEMFVSGDRLIVICNPLFVCYECCDCVSAESEKTSVYVYDISSPESAELLHKLCQDGGYNTSRLYDGKLYLITNYYIYNGKIVKNNPETYVPGTYCDDEKTLVPNGCIEILPSIESISYTVCACYDPDDCSLIDTESILGGCDQIYMSENAIYLTKSEFDEISSEEYKKDGYTVTDHSTKRYTDIYRISVDNGLEFTADGRVDGYIESQFSLDEYDGKLRVVTTNSYESYSIYTDEKHNFGNYEWHNNEVESDNALYVLDSELNEISSVTGLAENEYVYSVRFDGEYVYFCTFRQTDPLFAVDLSDAENPEVLSKFKISGFSDYLHVWNDEYLFGLGMEADDEGRTSSMKMVMFDISDKSDVKAVNSAILDDNYSEALYNHKALLIVPEKNIIGFQCDDSYCVFSYTDSGFALKQEVELPEEWGGFRGIVIGDYIYAVYDSGLSVISIGNFSIVKEI